MKLFQDDTTDIFTPAKVRQRISESFKKEKELPRFEATFSIIEVVEKQGYTVKNGKLKKI